MRRILELPYDATKLHEIEKWDEVILSGTLYVGRDQVHKRLCRMLSEGIEPPFPFKGNGIYYMGPSPAPEGHVIGAAGPTTSRRMDPFSPSLVAAGLLLMVGKGPRGRDVEEAVLKYGGVYLQAFGGCGALYASAIRSVDTVAFPELGPEALLKLEVHDFPTICILSSTGR